jgi:uncharacterized membrane protein YhaH (DUF805 family)
MIRDQTEKLSAEPGSGVSRIPSAVLVAVELLLLLAVLAEAWAERRGMPLVPTSNPDTWGYLNPALSWLSGHGLHQTDGRDWFYSALLALFLKTAGSFAGIVLWQKYLAIGSGIFMAVTWRCWVSTLPFQRRARFFFSLGGALPILIQLANPQSINFEVAIRPEAVLPFFVYGQLACLMGYYKYRWQSPKALASTILGAAAIVLAYACVLVKPSWLLAFAVTSAPVFAGIFGRALSLKTRLLAPALGIVFSFLLLWLPGAVYLVKDSVSGTFLPSTLFTVHARLIDRALEAKVARMRESDPERAKLRALVDLLGNELHIAEEHPGPFEKLGYDPDYLFYHSPLIPAIYSYTGNDDKKFKAFCISCYEEAALHDPVAFGGKILAQSTYFLFPKRDSFYRALGDFTGFYRDSLTDLKPYPADQFRGDVKAMYLQYNAELAMEAGSGLRLDGTWIFKRFCQLLCRLALPLEILFFATFAAALVWRPLRDLRLGGWAALSLFSAPLGNAATVCVVHALDISRYRYTYGGFLLFALLAMTLFVSLGIARTLRHWSGHLAKRAEPS